MITKEAKDNIHFEILLKILGFLYPPPTIMASHLLQTEL